MSRAIVITSGKGGVGKTTTTANIGVALATLGHSVVVVDADIGLRNLDVALGLEDEISYTLVDVIDGRCRLKSALIRDKRYANLSLLAASQGRDKNSVTPEKMSALIADLGEAFEFVIIDCPAGIENGFRNAIAGATEAIVVTTPEVSAVRDADRVIGLLKDTHLTEPKLLVNKVRPEMVRRREMMDVEDVVDILDIPLIGAVPEEGEIVIASNRGETVAAGESTTTGAAYRDVAKRILGEEVEYRSLKKHENVFTRLAGILRAGG